MKIYQVYVETSQEVLDEGGPLAHVPELPGCTARAPTLDAVQAAIRQAIRDYAAFLRAPGRPLDPERNAPDEFEIEVIETDSYTLPPDYATLTPEELAQERRWLDASRQAVLDALAELPPQAWDWKPGEKEWPLRTLVGHLGNAELYLTDKLIEPEHAPFDRLSVTRQAALDRLDALQDLGRVTTFDGEDWTPRKVLRRMLEHEQEHLAQIRALVARLQSKDQEP